MALWGIVAGAALAQQSDEDRLKKLEEKVLNQQEESDQLKKSKPRVSSCSASWPASEFR